MKENFLTRLAEMSNVQIQVLNGYTHRQLIDEVLLPKVLRPGGQDSRGWRISDGYMSLIAEFGEYLYNEDTFTGSLLLEIALQRLSCGAVLHAPTSYDVLPKGYEQYSAKYDQYGLMTDKCWLFLTSQINICLKDKNTKDHAEKIVLGLINHINNDGEPLSGYMLNGTSFEVSNKEVLEWATGIAFEKISFDKVYETIATERNWNRFSWLNENWDKVDCDDFFKRIKVKGFFAKRKVRKAIFAM